ncbi:hypothetical protein G7Z17_g13050 [Cylindrodendrum hubeiense]|uniref:CENP-V/GFA domain-containing protein n=1 Tax=Cylindrodendrum hubeiense TaxID=595255 RepID=A0A9P5GXT4_9HYPO|nr:hypothetical protein G7Z17_g13050 [Cylindrodendrum hubeiense]
MTSQTTGGCSCGSLRYSFNGEPITVATCHCESCRRSTSSSFSTNILVPKQAFHLQKGNPKTFTRQGDSGLDSTDNFCQECGSLIYVLGKAAPLLVFIKAGSLDDLSLNDTKYKPAVEIYCKYKYKWLPAFESTKTFEGTIPV